jgi:phosphoadenosine phosphosulfate reductase
MSTVEESKVPDAAGLDRRLQGQDLDTVLRTVAAAFEPGRLAVVTAFGPGSLVVLHELHRLGIRLPVIFIDTLHHFPETLALVEEATGRYDLDLRVYRPAESREAFEALYGPRLWERDIDRYQQVSKVEPFRQATVDLHGWITGRRREQSNTRSDLPIVEGGETLRVNPLVDWTRTDVWRFILDRGVPYNPLHDRGYRSIGDEPLTSPVGEGEEERAGRWRGSDRTECGIHLV